MFACNYQGGMDVSLKPICEFQLQIPEEKKEINHV